MKKRQDLQGLRGIAISAVVLFHFFPDFFPNGYIGVDQFFVLSGFLMTMIFGHGQLITIKSTRTFYYRRIKRIIPLYLLMIVLVLAFVIVLLPSPFVSLNIESAIAATLLYKNMATRSDNNEYFMQLSQADDLFTHTWSLAVEMQFYLLVPFIFLLYQLKSVSRQWMILLAMEKVSFMYYSLANSNTAFNSVFCRVWQFGIGIIAFMLTTEQPQQSEEKVPLDETIGESDYDENEDRGTAHRIRLSYALLVALIASCLSPIVLPQGFLRPVATVLTGAMIVAGSRSQCELLTARWLVFLGDISYALYLIHWPVVICTKFYTPDHFQVCLVAISACVAMAWLISKTFEQYYLSLSAKGIFYLTFSLYTAIAVLIFSNDLIRNYLEPSTSISSLPQADKWTNISLDTAIDYNKRWNRDEYKNLVAGHCHPNTTEHGFCSFEKGGLHGHLNVLIIGNSYAANAAELIYDTFGNVSSNISKFSQSSCEVLVRSNTRCQKAFDSYLNYVKKLKPDVLLIVCRMFKMSERLNKSVSDDTILSEARSRLKEYSSVVKKRIFVLDAMSGVQSNHIGELNKRLEKQRNSTKSIEVMHSSPVENEKYINGQRRNAELAKSCPSCVFYTYVDALSDENGKMILHDPITKLSFFTGGSHLTAAGLERVRPVYERLAEELSNS
ncbi:hypothetical protein Q1695_004744 [Nippostrongylus brasiliensis]|nr:hypothetical protein Q1695_004744 [Nippostrongylus brasiliensis]